MTSIWRMVRRMFRRARPSDEAASSEEVQEAVFQSRSKAQNTNDLITQLKTHTTPNRLERARLNYEERLHGTGQR